MTSKTLSAAVFFGLLGLSIMTVKDITAKEATPPAAQQGIQDSKKTPEPIAKKAPIAVHPEIPLSPELQRFTRAQAFENGVPYILALAVMEQESRFQLDADGGDSFGVMQINECHGPKEIIIEPHENIRIGCYLLGAFYREYRDWNKALVAYNCGPAGAEQMYFRHGSISSPYSREVMFRSENFARLLGEPSVLMPK